jgi:hypothetical protein
MNDLLKEHDIRVSITQDTINTQFYVLMLGGIIHRNITIKDEESETELTAQLYMPDTESKATPFPMVDFSPYGDLGQGKVMFYVRMDSGTFTLWEGVGPKQKKVTKPFKNWVYAFKVSMDEVLLTDSQLTELKGKDYVPKLVKNIDSSVFTVSQLYMDFQNANISDYDTDHSTDFQHMSSKSIQQFIQLITIYFKKLKDTENPYILGYSIKQKPHTQPAVLEPTSGEISTYYNKRNEGLNTLDFLLMTHNKALPIDDDRCKVSQLVDSTTYDGKIMIANDLFFEKYFKPYILERIKYGLPDGGIWKEEVTHGKWTFSHIEDNFDTSGEVIGHVEDVVFKNRIDLYRKKRASVSCSVEMVAGPNIKVTGSGVVYERRYLYCYPNIFSPKKATWLYDMEVTQPFSFDMTMEAGKEGKIILNGIFKKNTQEEKTKESRAVKLSEFFFKTQNHRLIESIKYRIERIQEEYIHYFENCIESGFNLLSHKIILPAGDVFFFKNIRFDDDRNVCMDISYKTEH